MYIGKYHAPMGNAGPLSETNDGKMIKLYPAYQIMVATIPQPTQEGIQLKREITAMPFICTIRDEPIWVKAEVLQQMAELKDEDKARYKSLVDQANELMTQVSAQAAGLATARRMPGPGSA
jgi:hypothetical protein